MRHYRDRRWLPKASVAAVIGMLLATGCSADNGPSASDSRSANATTTSALTNVPTVLVVDSSGSMATEDVAGGGSRLDAAKSASSALVNSLPPETTFAAVAYGANTTSDDGEANKARSCKDIEVVVPAAPAKPQQAAEAINKLKPGGYTPVADSLTAASGLVSGKAVIVLISDGEDTCAPPDACDTATALKASNPDLLISVVGFHINEEQLRCIAEATGGFYVTADNAAQLASRLKAARLADTAAATLSPSGYRNIALGATRAQIQQRHSSFPNDGTTAGDTVVIEWEDCTYTFTKDVLTEIAPRNPSTIDGLTTGSTVSDVTALLGEPEETESATSGTVELYRADSSGATWKITADPTGRVRTIVLCSCLPAAVTAQTVANMVVPAGTCGPDDGGPWDQSLPITLRNGTGEKFTYSNGEPTSGAYIIESGLVGSIRLAAGQPPASVVWFRCAGSPKKYCCAGRTSTLVTIAVVDLTGTPRRVAPSIWPRASSDDLGRLIDSERITVSGNEITTHQTNAYDDPNVPGNSVDETVTYTYASGEWSMSVDP